MNGVNDDWKIRRRIVVGTLLFCAAILARLVVGGDDTELNQSIANGVVLLAGSVISGYVFGAVLDDNNKRKRK